MAIFFNIDKKIITISAILLIVILSAGFVIYKYTAGSSVNMQNLTGGAQTEQETQ